MPFIDATQCYLANVSNQKEPPEGPIAIPVPGLDFTTTPIAPPDGLVLDLTNIMAQNKFSMLQGLYIDNFDGSGRLEIQVQGSTGQRILIPANAVGYIPVLAMNPAKLKIIAYGAYAAGTSPKIFLLNFPVAPVVYLP